MKRNKYRAVKTIVDGIKFDSKKGAARYSQLKLLVRAGVVTKLELQPRYDLTINTIKCGFYKADFRYFENGREVVEDVKGMKTDVYKIKKAIMKSMGYNIIET